MKKLFMSLILIATSVGYAFADLQVVEKKGKYGYADSDGKVVVKHQYDEARPFVNGRALVRQGDKYGYLKEDGKVLIKPEWDFIGAFNKDGYVWVGRGKTLADSKKGVYHEGKIVIPAKYSTVGFFNPEGEFDVAPGRVNVSKTDSKHSQTDMNFSKLNSADIPYIYACGGYNKYLLFDLDGKQLIQTSANLFNIPSDGILLATEIRNSGKYEGNYYKLDGTKKRLFKRNLYYPADEAAKNKENLYGFKSGTAAVCLSDKAYLIDASGNQVGKEYRRLESGGRDVYIYTASNGCGLLSQDGKEITGADYWAIIPPHSRNTIELFAASNKAGKSGYLNSEGKEVIPFEYDVAGVWVSDRGKVKTSNGYGMIDKDGKIIINPQWEEIYVTVEPFDHLWMKSKNDGMWYAVNVATDKVVTTSPVKELEAPHLAGDKAYVKDGEKHGMVALNGDMIIPLEFENSGTVERAYKYIHGLGKNRMGTTDKHRFLLYSNPNTSNKLADKVPSEQWDY